MFIATAGHTFFSAGKKSMHADQRETMNAFKIQTLMNKNPAAAFTALKVSAGVLNAVNKAENCRMKGLSGIFPDIF